MILATRRVDFGLARSESTPLHAFALHHLDSVRRSEWRAAVVLDLSQGPELSMIDILQEPIHTIPLPFLGFWYVRSCRINVISSSSESKASLALQRSF